MEGEAMASQLRESIGGILEDLRRVLPTMLALTQVNDEARRRPADHAGDVGGGAVGRDINVNLDVLPGRVVCGLQSLRAGKPQWKTSSIRASPVCNATA